ncbi:serine-type D-Ala-D-Ala carboxypeptidase [Photobacterium sp. SDRW27]|uniref:serine-type D-Ala-D-Ala carboxypeptidase n=1 Tax=Photobacterium obscurum TaxID=2829490 RepID=UPI00224451BF|nr:serine-type D-Ala-D-Ala carboxypeptidase [Photobacterium obscurum]MCW8330052.1 serine-type D-Ala-D-Ala carboxypeptidase [Photobacterium obscurum]
MFRVFPWLLGLLLSLPVSANFSPQPAINQLPVGHDVALLITDTATGEPLYAQRESQLQAPASTQKLITALAAKLYLGDSFRFTTDLERNHDDIIIRFSGDPTLSRQQLAALLTQLKKHRLSTIKGNIILNGSVFSGYERAPGWPWDILGVCYSAPSSSISLEHNCVQGALYSNKALGQLTRVNVPAHQPIKVASDAVIVSKEQQKARYCDLTLTADSSNNYQLSGCLPKRDQPLPLNFAVQNTIDYTEAVIRSELKRAGIRFDGKVVRDDKTHGKRIARHTSEPLDELLDIMVKESDNLIADNLAKTIGHNYFKQPGTFNNGVAAIKAILKDQAGIDLTKAVLVDGSGLSRNNRLTVSQMMEVVTYLYQHDKTLELLKTLPVSGQSGTLRYRQSIRHQPLQGNIAAKSGSLFGTYNLAGIMTAKSGKKLLFVQFTTNYHPEEPAEDAPKVAPPIERFERELYRKLYESF